jgi:hypothetical protein
VASLSFCCLQAVLPMPAALKQSRRSRRSRRSWQSSESRTFTVVTCSHNVVILEWLQVLALEGLRLLQNRTDGIAFFWEEGKAVFLLRKVLFFTPYVFHQCNLEKRW